MKGACLLFALTALVGGMGKVFHTQEQALRLAFDKSEVQRTTHYWTEDQRDRIAALAEAKGVRSLQVEYRRADEEGKPIDGTSVWFDTRVVRSKAQTLMIVVDAEGKVQDLVVCSFEEPLDYKPKDRWYAQFEKRALDEEMRLKKGIHGVSGATMTARATTAAVREVLAAHAVAHPAPGEEEDAGEEGHGGKRR